jgi:hypothetical protein
VPGTTEVNHERLLFAVTRNTRRSATVRKQCVAALNRHLMKGFRRSVILVPHHQAAQRIGA